MQYEALQSFCSLRYWTDNGACYYYNTGNYSNYEEMLDGVITDAENFGIPYRYFQVKSTTMYPLNQMLFRAKRNVKVNFFLVIQDYTYYTGDT